jgi:type IV secretory pathway TrbD component
MNATRRRTDNSGSLSLPLEPAQLPRPAANIRPRAAAKRPKAKAAKTKKAGANPQAFLPGMSRRGRPRAKLAVAATERAANSRRRRLAAGAKRVELMLDGTALAQLDALVAHLDETRAGVVSWLLARAAARLLK